MVPQPEPFCAKEALAKKIESQRPFFVFGLVRCLNLIVSIGGFFSEKAILQTIAQEAASLP